MTIGNRPPREGQPRALRFGLWRAVAAIPTVLGSLLLLLLAGGALGRWAALFPLAWAACATLLMSRLGERLTVGATCRFHRPSPWETAALQPAWTAALRVTGTDAGTVELYVQPARVANAYAAGRRSVAVTSRIVEDYELSRLTRAQLVAVLVHELGHHATGATRSMLLVWWFAAPGRLATSLLTGLARSLAAHQPRSGQVMVMVAGMTVAETRALQQGQWMIGGVLLFVGLSAALCPLASAAVSRQAEFAADRFAGTHGLALELAAALRATDVEGCAASAWPRRLLASHPASEQRIRALLRQRIAEPI